MIVERLRMALTLNVPANYHPGTDEAGARIPCTSVCWHRCGPISTGIAGDAPRIAGRCVAAPAIAITVIWSRPYEHWLTITLVLTLQPYFALTINVRWSEWAAPCWAASSPRCWRWCCTTPIAIAVAMFPLATIALAV